MTRTVRRTPASGAGGFSPATARPAPPVPDAWLATARDTLTAARRVQALHDALGFDPDADVTATSDAAWDSAAHATTEYLATPYGICPVCRTNQPMLKGRMAPHSTPGIEASRPPCPGRDQLPLTVWRDYGDGTGS